MSRISREQVERMASLARIRVSPDEVRALQGQLDAILDYVEELSAVDTTGVEATYHALPLPTPFRDDQPAASLDPMVAVRNAPASAGSAFAVPAVLEGEEEG